MLTLVSRTVLLVVAAASFAGLASCQTAPPPATPATSTAIAGPAPRSTVLQRAHDQAPLFPAKEGGGGHDHHHHAPAGASLAPAGGGR